LRTLPVVAAAPELLVAQQPKQTAVHFLLDPDVSLAKTLLLGSELSSAQLAQAVGMKFRYLRSQADISITAMAARLNTQDHRVAALELGRHTALPLYLAYLEALALSWPEFAALEVPPAWLTAMQEPRHMQLRLCPTPDCPNHQPSANGSVKLSADLPGRGMARFRCPCCGRSFTRTYTGRLTGKPRRPPIQPGDPPTVPKSPAEIARLVELGLQGRDNREIAHQLGWGEKTVRMYWISLGLETQVHQAQVQRRAQEKLERHASIRVRIDASLQDLLARDEKISARQVGRALGFNADYLNTHPLLAVDLQEQIRMHNCQVAERQVERLRTRIADTLAELPNCEVDVTFREIAQAVGLSADYLRRHYPELSAMVRAALVEHLARIKTARSQAECARINAAATRLAAQGRSLGVTAICREAGLHKYRCRADPVLMALMHQWIDDDGPSD
jgi:transposase-like protein